MEVVKHSYKDDCIFLLKDLTNVVSEITVDEKEDLIRRGVSYSEVISKECKPTEATIKIFKNMLETSAEKIAYYVGKISSEIFLKKEDNIVIVSLARGGTPYGILMKKFLKFKYNISIPHYSISIIRGRGIDYNALKYILKKHQGAKIQFVDGWTGKGSIINELNKSVKLFNEKYNVEIDSSLAVIADPAKLCNVYGTREDIIIPNCCLNATVSGLISRTILNETYIGRDDFHGAKTLGYLKDYDLSQYFIDTIADKFEVVEDKFNLEKSISEKYEKPNPSYSKQIVDDICAKYKVRSINSVKLSIGESARVLLRRKTRLLLVKDINDENVSHIINLAKEKNVEIEIYEDSLYKAIALIDEGN